MVWYELLNIINIQLGDNNQEIPTLEFLDALLSVRIINTANQDDKFKYLPDILEKQSLWLSQNTTLFKLGYIDMIIGDYKNISIDNEEHLAKHFSMVANQPFVEQILYETNFISGEKTTLSSIILGCKFSIKFKSDFDLLFVAETILAFLESFLGTSLTDAVPNTEEVIIEVVKSKATDIIRLSNKNSSFNNYILEINKFEFDKKTKDKTWETFLEFIATLLSRNFFMKDPKIFLENLFKKEEVHERVSLILEHRNFMLNILGENYKLFYDDWRKNSSLKEYPLIRKTPLLYTQKEFKKSDKENINFENVAHNKRKVFSVIEKNLWDNAKWKGFGFFGNNAEFGIFIAFDNMEYGIKIFENWINRFGNEDKDEAIKITIIIGVDKNNPYWYRVHIGSKMKLDENKRERLIISASRIHEMNANNPNNLENLIRGYNHFKKYLLCPAVINENGKIELLTSKGILKKRLHIRESWQIGLNDLDSVAIKKDDKPIIPKEEKNAPILELLKKKSE